MVQIFTANNMKTIHILLVAFFATIQVQAQGIMLAGGAVEIEAGFDANDIANLEGWYSATDFDADGIENEEASAPATWYDKSANGRNLTKTGTVDLAIGQVNGQNVARFYSGTTGYYQASTASDWTFLHNASTTTVFIVFEVGAGSTNTNSFNVIYTTFQFSSGLIGSGFGVDDRSSSSRNDALFYTVSKGVSGQQPIFDIQNNTVSHNAFHLLTVNSDPDNSIAANRSSYKLDGSLISGTNSNTFSPSSSAPQYPLTLGSIAATTSFDLQGYIAEIIIYSRDLSSSERTEVESYLSNKYGL